MPPMGPPDPDPAIPPPAAPAAPPAMPPTTPGGGVIPMSADDLQFWRTEIERAEKLRNDTIAQWDVIGNLERYTPRSVRSLNETTDWRINTGKDFADVERKKAALFYDTPQITLIPEDGTPNPPLMAFQDLLNAMLGPKRMHCKAMVLPTIQDCLVAIQPCPTEIGYVAVTENVAQPQTDPVTGQPMIDPLGQPVVQQVPVVVWEQIFWDKLSAKSTLLPVDLKNAQYDKAPWIGYRWRKPVTQVRRQFQLGPEVSLTDNSGGRENDPATGVYFETLTNATNNNGEPQATGVKLWYRAYLRDPNVSHPELIRELELIDGMDQPVVHRNCPYQTIGPDGRLTPDSMIGFPEHPLALRDLTDAAFIAADCTLTGPLTRELNKFRTQIVQRRDGSKLHLLIDASKVSEEVRQKIGQGNEPTMIPVEPEALAGGTERIMAQVPSITLGRENYEGQAIIERDRAQILGIDANQVGGGSDRSQTATEVTTIQRNADARFEQERQRALAWWLSGVQKVAALVLRYGDRLAVEILGQERGQMWVQAKNSGALGRYRFDIVIDSGNYVDIEARKRQDMQLYNMTAQDPSTHHQEVLLRLATDFGIDPQRWIVTKPPEQKPPAPTLSIAVKPEDLDPRLPSYIGTYAILTAGGVKGLPAPIVEPLPQAPIEAEHGGMAELAPRLNQHQMDETGQRSGPPV